MSFEPDAGGEKRQFIGLPQLSNGTGKKVLVFLTGTV